jgi:hypothetical protein
MQPGLFKPLAARLWLLLRWCTHSFDKEILEVSLQLREAVVNFLAGVEPFGDVNIVFLVPIVHEDDDSIVVNVSYHTPDLWRGGPSLHSLMSLPQIYHGGDYVLLRFSKISFIPLPTKLPLNPFILKAFKGG